MAKVLVQYVTVHEQTIDWPESEMDNLNYENLMCNLDINRSASEIEEISGVFVDREEVWL